MLSGISKICAGVCITLAAAAGFLWWELSSAKKENGRLQNTVASITEANDAAAAVVASLEQRLTDQANLHRAMLEEASQAAEASRQERDRLQLQLETQRHEIQEILDRDPAARDWDSTVVPSTLLFRLRAN